MTGVQTCALPIWLFQMTPLQDTFSCNFNILVAGMPRVMGVGAILEEWTAWRMDGVRRRTYFICKKKEEKLHLLKGLKRILLDIDKAIRIIRETEEEAEVVPNLIIGFGIDQVQAEYVADIRLRNINKEYILKRTEETASLEEEIADLKDIIGSPARIKRIITQELANVKKKYAAIKINRNKNKEIRKNKNNCCFLLFLFLEFRFCSCGSLLLGLLKNYFLAFSRA